MPSSYWWMWWSGFAGVAVVDVLTRTAGLAGPLGDFLIVGATAVWVVLFIQGVRISDSVALGLAFWWSLAALMASVLLTALSVTGVPASSPAAIAAALAWGAVWVLGGAAVLVVWGMRKARSK